MAARDHFRAHARRRVELAAKIGFREPSGALLTDSSRPHAPPLEPVRIRDLGLGGACFEVQEATSMPLEREAFVVLEVTAPTLWDPLTLKGKIAWLRRGGLGRPTKAGLRFEHRDSAALFALFQLLGAHAYDA